MPFKTAPAAYQLLLEGQIALAEIEHHGVRVDVGYLNESLDRTAAQIREIEDGLRADPVYKIWQKRHGEKTNLGSPAQLVSVVFGPLGYKSQVATASGERESASEKALAGVDHPFVRSYQRAQRLRKARGTYLEGIRREMVHHSDGTYRVHPSYNLNTVATFRSSCDGPAWQTNPNRIAEIAEIVRRCYIPLPGQQIIEKDYAQIEVRIGACYHKDPNMIRYINDPRSDMHRDSAARLFFLPKDQVSKQLRAAVKGIFVFAEFYGDYYIRCARGLWEECVRNKIRLGKNNDGILVIEHLASKGITEMGACDPDEDPRPGTFEAHVKREEKWLWEKQFPVYAQWKKDAWEDYLREGGLQMLTGFAVNAPLDRKQVANYKIQGSAFHCTLYSMPRINRLLRKHKMKSRAIGEIHDSIVFDGPPRERDDLIDLARHVMVKMVSKAWADWLIVPIETEAECCPIDRPWYEKAALVEREGSWRPVDEAKWLKLYGPWK